MKKFKLLTGMLLAAIISSISLGVGTLPAFAQQAELEGSGQAEISLEQDFDGTSVLVTMTEEISEVNNGFLIFDAVAEIDAPAREVPFDSCFA